MPWSKEERREYLREYMRVWREANREKVRAASVKSNRKHQAKRAAWRALPENRERAKQRSARWRMRLGPDEFRDRRFRREYGISLTEYNQKIVNQGGLCPICHGDLSVLKPHLDHDHKTKKVRDVLCSRCNQAIGLLLESPGSAERLAEYLRKHKAE